jgi:hypothetical protein
VRQGIIRSWLGSSLQLETHLIVKVWNPFTIHERSVSTKGI